MDFYNTSTNTWSTATLSQPGALMAAAATGNKVFFAGEDGPSGAVDILNLPNYTTVSSSSTHTLWAATTVSGRMTLSVPGSLNLATALLLNFSGNQPFSNSVSGSGNVVVSGPGAVTLQVPLSPTQTAVNQGQLVVPSGIVVSGNLVIGASGYCTNSGNMSSIGNFANAGIFAGNLQASGSFSNAPTGNVRIAAGQTVFLQGALPQSNAGLILALGTSSAPAQFESYGPFTNTAGGSGLIAAQNANLYFDGGLTNQAAVAFSYGISNVSGAVANSPSGTISVNGGAGVTFYGNMAHSRCRCRRACRLRLAAKAAGKAGGGSD